MTDEIEKLKAEIGFHRGRYNALKEQFDKAIVALRKIARFDRQEVYFPLTALSEAKLTAEQVLEVIDHEQENNDVTEE